MDEFTRFQTAWQRQTADGLSAGAHGEPMDAIRARLGRMHRTILVRDRLETGVGVAAALGVLAIGVRSSSSITRAGCLVLIAATIFIIVRLARVRAAAKSRPRGVSLTEWCRNERANVDDQIRLLQTVLWWYLAPVLIGVNLVAFGSAGVGPVSWLYLMATAIGAAVLYRLNLRAVRRTLQPLRSELNRILEELERNGQ